MFLGNTKNVTGVEKKIPKRTECWEGLRLPSEDCWGLTHKTLMVEGQSRVLESQNHRSIEITSVGLYKSLIN